MSSIKQFFTQLKDSSYRYFILLALVLVSLPVNMNLNALFITIFALNAILSTSRDKIETDRASIVLYAFYFLYFLSALISVYYSLDRATAYSKMETKLSLLFVPLAFLFGLKKLSPIQIKKLLRFFIISVLVCTMVCYTESLAQAILTLNPKELTDSFLSNPLMHRSYLSIFIGIAILLWWEDSSIMKSSRLVWISFLAVTIVLLQGRINILALFAVSSGMIFIRYFKAFALRQKLITLATGLVLIIGFTLIPKEYNRFNEPLTFDYDMDAAQDNDFTGLTIRLAIWDNVLPVIKENIWTGVGIGDSKTELLKQYHKSNFTKGKTNKFNCHNQYLESTLASGIAGLILLLTIGILYLVQSWKSKNAFVWAIVLFYFMSMITESLLERHWGVTTFAILLPLFFKYSSLKAD